MYAIRSYYELPMFTRKNLIQDIGQSVLIGLWFMFLTFPLLVIKVNTIENTIVWRWSSMFWVGGMSFVMCLLSRMGRRALARQREQRRIQKTRSPLARIGQRLHDRRVYLPLLAAGVLFFLIFPTQFSIYQITIMTTALV